MTDDIDIEDPIEDDPADDGLGIPEPDPFTPDEVAEDDPDVQEHAVTVDDA